MSRKTEWGRRSSDNQAYPKLPDKDVLPTGLRVVEGRISKKEGDTWMVRSSGGYAIVGRMFDDEAPVPMTMFIEHLEIDESLRGAGAGRFLAEAITKHAIRLGFNAIVLASAPDAVGFWNKLGYTQYEESEATIPMVRYMDEDMTSGDELSHARKVERVMDSIERFEHEKWEVNDILKITGGSKRLALEERRGAIDKKLKSLKEELSSLRIGDRNGIDI